MPDAAKKTGSNNSQPEIFESSSQLDPNGIYLGNSPSGRLVFMDPSQPVQDVFCVGSFDPGIELKSRPCEECGTPIWMPKMAAPSVCFTCPCCGYRSCEGE